MNSINSCNFSSRRCWVRNITSFAHIHKTAQCLVGGHSVNWGRFIHSSIIRSCIVLSIRVSLCFVQSQICFPSPHSVRRCPIVSFLAHLLHMSVGTILILLSLSCVGSMSWITLYQAALFVSDTGASLRLIPTAVHVVWAKVLGRAFPRFLFPLLSYCATCHIFFSYMLVVIQSFLVVSRTLLLSLSSQILYRSRNPVHERWVLALWRQIPKSHQFCCYRPDLRPCVRMRWRNNAQLFAVRFIRSQPASSFLLWRVDMRTRKMSPLHMYREVDVVRSYRVLYKSVQVTILLPGCIHIYIWFICLCQVPVVGFTSLCANVCNRRSSALADWFL